MVNNGADLPNAIVLNSWIVNARRIVGPSIGYSIVGWAGGGWCFAIDAISHVAADSQV